MPSRRPTVHLLSIGDELCFGRTVDTNAAYLARACTDRGFEVLGTTVVGDGSAAIRRGLAAVSADLVLMTGGLGPTEDDRTREALAAHVGVTLVEDPRAWRTLRARWRALRGGQEPPAANRVQALVPQGATLLPNDRGTAPGLLLRHGTTWYVCLPGVPHEMMAMATRLMRRVPRLVPQLPRVAVGEVWLAGIGESAVQDLVPGAFLPGDPAVGITVSDQGHLVIRAVGSPRAVRTRLAHLRVPLAAWLLPAPGLAPSVVQCLQAQGHTVGTAESCTVGLVAAALGAVPGASAVLPEAVVTYAPEAKRRRLGVAPRALHEVVSQACVEAMARGARRHLGVVWAIATTGYAGPSGGTASAPVGTVWVAVAGPQGVVARRIHVDGDRQRVQRRAVAEALLLAWECIGRGARVGD